MFYALGLVFAVSGIVSAVWAISSAFNDQD
jgi:hypothetical protein